MTKHIKKKWYSFHTPFHSDNLVHWTGQDIMYKHAELRKEDLLSINVNADKLWEDLIKKNFIDSRGKKLEKLLKIKNPKDLGLNSPDKNNVAFKAIKSVKLYANQKNYTEEVVNEFLQRLKNILNFGLWMTKRRDGDDYIETKEGKFPKPYVPRVCFTELKISDSLLHADKFGPMGIGFKRLFVLNRIGSPVYYISKFGYHPIISKNSKFYNPDNKELKDIKPEDINENVAFFKNMSSGRDIQEYITYDLYDESEWRIIFSENIKKRIPSNKLKYFIDPKDPSIEEKYRNFYNNLKEDSKPDYLIPVDEWLSIIIYPNLQIKNASMMDIDIRRSLCKLKCYRKEKILAEGIPQKEVHNFPIEIGFGALRNI